MMCDIFINLLHLLNNRPKLLKIPFPRDDLGVQPHLPFPSLNLATDFTIQVFCLNPAQLKLTRTNFFKKLIGTQSKITTDEADSSSSFAAEESTLNVNIN